MRILCGGEPLNSGLAASLLDNGNELYNLYGPTETTVWSMIARVEKEQPISLGAPIAGTSIYLLDEALRPVLSGMTGEIFIGGAGVAIGYLSRPDLTAERFIPDPFSPEAGRRMYRTGDRAQLAADDRLIFLGRNDSQVKIRGFRVELGEVEQALRQHPKVAQCAVVIQTPAARDARIVAFVTPKSGVSVDAMDVRRFLAARLPEHAVPAIVYELAELPLTPNAKVDRKRLRDLDVIEAAQELHAEQPSTVVESILVGVWAGLLGVHDIGSHTNFFSVSGNSLLAARLIARIRDVFGVEIPLAAVFEAPTVAMLASRIEGSLGQTVSGPAHRDIEPADGWPLSPSQERLFFLYQMVPDSPDYNLVMAFRVRNALDRDAFDRAVSWLAERHPLLASRYGWHQGEARQYTGRGPEVHHVDLRCAQDAEAQARCASASSASAPFDLEAGPVMRVAVFAVADDNYVVVITVHHIIADGWSIDIIARDLLAFYLSEANQLVPKLPALPIHFGDYAMWQRDRLQQAAGKQTEFWRRTLAAAQPLLLPESPEGTGGGQLSLDLPEALASAIDRFAASQNLTPFLMHAAALHIVLHSYTGQTDQIVGTDLADRRWPSTENVVGFFVNNVPLRVDLSGDPSLQNVAERVRRALLSAYANQDLPFHRITAAAVPASTGRKSPLVNTLIVAEMRPQVDSEAGPFEWEPVELPPPTPKFPLCVFVGHRTGSARVTWRWQRERLSGAVVAGMARRYQAVLTTMTEDSSRKLSSLGPAQIDDNMDPDPLAGLGKRRRSSSTRPAPAVVSTQKISGGRTTAIMIERLSDHLDPRGWAASERSRINEYLLQHGAVLFRGFGIDSEVAFENFASTLCSPLFGEYGDLPRAHAGGAIYGSTPYPAEHRIHFHNESSHLKTWPRKQLFFCHTPSKGGGETPIADVREILEVMPASVRSLFADRQLLYVRNFSPNLDVDWKDFFRTSSRDEVTERCREARMECVWQREDRLAVYSRRPAILNHPVTGDALFFNQIRVHHPACLPAAVRDSMAAMFGPDEFPRNVLFGDGTVIPDALVEEVGALYDRVALVFPWQRGDVLLVDNMRVAHARNAFEGPRRILVAMGEMTTATEEQVAGHSNGA